MMKCFVLLLLSIAMYIRQVAPTNISRPVYIRPSPSMTFFTPPTRPGSEPEQVHVSLCGKDCMRVSWITADKGAPSTVEYGKEPGQYDVKETGERTSYRYMLYKSGSIHHVTLGPLDFATSYYYRCSGAGSEFNFRTPPASFPVEFAVAGDLGQTESSRTTLQQMGEEDYDVLLMPGDLSYADRDQTRWDSFGRFVEPEASRRPWIVTSGNHDIERLRFVGKFIAYNARWRMVDPGSGSQSNLYYSFDVAGAHVLMLGSYSHCKSGSDQYTWLKADLAKVDRERTPWLIVVFHAPWYNTNSVHQLDGEAMRFAMEKLLYAARVDVIFAGHVHAYERFTRVYRDKADRCGPVHITIGDGGNREGLAWKFQKPSPAISLFQEPSFGHGRLKIINNTHAHWSWHRNDDSYSVIADRVWLHSLSSFHHCKANNATDRAEYSSASHVEL